MAMHILPKLDGPLMAFLCMVPYGPDGVLLYPCTHASAHETYCLDTCNGMSGALPDVDEYLYRYYISGTRGDITCSSSVENSDDGICDSGSDAPCCTNHVAHSDFWPYTIGCYVGCTFQDLASGVCTGTPGYTFSEATPVDGTDQQNLNSGSSTESSAVSYDLLSYLNQFVLVLAAAMLSTAAVFH